MACSSCGSASGVRVIQKLVKKQLASANCEYTTEILEDYLATLKCVKDNNIFTSFNLTYAKINSLIGIVKSAKNYSTNPCYFKGSLDKLTPLITLIKESNQC